MLGLHPRLSREVGGTAGRGRYPRMENLRNLAAVEAAGGGVEGRLDGIGRCLSKMTARRDEKRWKHPRLFALARRNLQRVMESRPPQ